MKTLSRASKHSAITGRYFASRIPENIGPPLIRGTTLRESPFTRDIAAWDSGGKCSLAVCTPDLGCIAPKLPRLLVLYKLACPGLSRRMKGDV